jgi:hypothetical protein
VFLVRGYKKGSAMLTKDVEKVIVGKFPKGRILHIISLDIQRREPSLREQVGEQTRFLSMGNMNDEWRIQLEVRYDLMTNEGGTYELPDLRFGANYVIIPREKQRMPIEESYVGSIQENFIGYGKTIEEAVDMLLMCIDKWLESVNIEQLVT